MTDEARPDDRDWTDETARLGRDAALRPFVERGHALILFDEAGARRLHANPAGERLTAAGFAPQALKRIAALAEGLAPASGLRLERLQVGAGEAAATLTLVSRRVRLSDGAGALLLAALAPPPAEEPAPREPDPPAPVAAAPAGPPASRPCHPPPCAATACA